MNEQGYLGLLEEYNEALIRKDSEDIRLLNQKIYEEEFMRYSELIAWRKLYLKNGLDNTLIKDVEEKIKITLGRLELLMSQAVIIAQKENKSDKEENK